MCRDAEVLSLFAAIITKLRELMAPEVPRVFEAIFECTLQMITKNFAVGPWLLSFITYCMLPNAVCPGRPWPCFPASDGDFLGLKTMSWLATTCSAGDPAPCLDDCRAGSERCGSSAQVSVSGLCFPSHICQLLTKSRESRSPSCAAAHCRTIRSTGCSSLTCCAPSPTPARARCSPCPPCSSSSSSTPLSGPSGTRSAMWQTQARPCRHGHCPRCVCALAWRVPGRGSSDMQSDSAIDRVAMDDKANLSAPELHDSAASPLTCKCHAAWKQFWGSLQWLIMLLYK